MTAANQNKSVNPPITNYKVILLVTTLENSTNEFVLTTQYYPVSSVKYSTQTQFVLSFYDNTLRKAQGSFVNSAAFATGGTFSNLTYLKIYGLN